MSTRVYVGRIPRDARESDLRDHFGTVATPRDILLKDGYGFMEFDTPQDAEDVCRQLNGRDFMHDR